MGVVALADEPYLLAADDEEVEVMAG